jgi:hypothetical protein
VYDPMANLPAGCNAQYNVVANNKRYEFFNDAVCIANAIQDNADANPTNCDAPADIQVEIELADGTVESRIVEMVPDHTPHAFMAHMSRHTSPRLHGDSERLEIQKGRERVHVWHTGVGRHHLAAAQFNGMSSNG